MVLKYVRYVLDHHLNLLFGGKLDEHNITYSK